MTGKCWNASPPRQAIALEFHPRERRKSTARIARRPAIPRTSRRNLRGAVIAEVCDAFYTLDASEASEVWNSGDTAQAGKPFTRRRFPIHCGHDSRGHRL